ISGELHDVRVRIINKKGEIRARAGEPARLVLEIPPRKQRPNGAAKEPEPAGTDQSERAAARAEACRDMAADQAAEGEAGEVEALACLQHPLQSLADDRRDALGGVGLGRGGGGAEAPQIGADDAGPAGKDVDIAQPMRPRAEAAMQQDQGRARAPAAPHHAAGAARRLAAARTLGELCHRGGGVWSAGHPPVLVLPKNGWITRSPRLM